MDNKCNVPLVTKIKAKRICKLMKNLLSLQRQKEKLLKKSKNK